MEQKIREWSSRLYTIIGVYGLQLLTVFYAGRYLSGGVVGQIEDKFIRWLVICVLVIVFGWISQKIVTHAAVIGKILVGMINGFKLYGVRHEKLLLRIRRGKWRLETRKKKSTMSICYMIPPEEGKKYSMISYVLGSEIANLVCGILIFLIFLFCVEKTFPVMVFLFVYSICSAGYSMERLIQRVIWDWEWLMKHNRADIRREFRLGGLISYEHGNGKRFAEMPAEWFLWEDSYEIMSYETEWYAFYCYQYLQEKGCFAEADRFAEDILLPYAQGKTTIRKVLSDRLYLKMLLEEDIEEIKEYYESVKTVLLESTLIDTYRVLYLYLNYVTGLPETAAKYYKLWEEELPKRIWEYDIQEEKKLMKQMEDKWGGKL